MIRQLIVLIVVSASCGQAKLSSVNISSVKFRKNCLTQSCSDYYDNLIEATIKKINPCRNAYLHHCKGNYKESENILENFKANVKKSYQPDKAKVLSISKMFGKEYQLYQGCVKFNPDNVKWASLNWDTLVPMEKLSDDKWSPINEMTSPGSYIFFDISVERNPNDAEKNIIVLRPPSLHSEYLKNILRAVELVYHKIKDISDDDSEFGDDIEEEFCKNCKKPKSENQYLQVKDFVNKFIHTINNNSDSDDFEVTNLKKWIKDYNSRVNYNFKTKIDWMHIFNTTFGEFGYEIDEHESLLVYNRDYFKSIYAMLNHISNDELELFALSKNVSENLGYLDWKSIENRDIDVEDLKDHFCRKEIKPYGLTFIVFNLLLKKNNFELSVLNHTISVFKSKIFESQELSGKMKNYLWTQLRTITEDITNMSWRNIEDNESYYEDFELTNNHLLNILNYRKIIKKKIFKKLRDDTRSPIAPLVFSFDELNNLENPNSKLVAYFASYLDSNLSNEIPVKELIFSNFGTKIAQEIYSILTDNSELKAFNKKRLNCLAPDNKENLEKDDLIMNNGIGHFYGFRIAYEAMSKVNDSKINNHKVSFPNKKSMLSDRLFVASNMFENCPEGPVNNFVISKSPEYSSIYKCYESYVKNKVKVCELPAF